MDKTKETVDVNSILYLYEKMNDLPQEMINKIIKNQCITAVIGRILKSFDGFHYHDDMYEILYMLEGEAKYIVEDKVYNLQPGDMMLVSPNELHQLISPNPSKRIVCTFSDKYLSQFNTEYTNFQDIFNILKFSSNHKISFSGNDKAKIETFLLRMASLLFSEEFGDDIKYNMAFTRIMLLVSERLIEHEELTHVPYITNPIIKNIVDYINENISNKILIEDIADYLGLSNSYLSHIFKEHTGVSILKFINKKRLVHAKELLRQGKRIEDIANECGFQDYTSFFRSFKKEFNITPKKYIKDQNLTHSIF